VLTRQKKEEESDSKQDSFVVKVFFCSGVKASFRKTLRKKLLQVTGNF
jgi:hypothetical protein